MAQADCVFEVCATFQLAAMGDFEQLQPLAASEQVELSPLPPKRSSLLKFALALASMGAVVVIYHCVAAGGVMKPTAATMGTTHAVFLASPSPPMPDQDQDQAFAAFLKHAADAGVIDKPAAQDSTEKHGDGGGKMPGVRHKLDSEMAAYGER